MRDQDPNRQGIRPEGSNSRQSSRNIYIWGVDEGETVRRVGVGTLLSMSGSTFLTLGLGDVTSADLIGRLFILLEAGSGYTFLALIVTYMPLLDQVYESREVGNLLIHSRAGRPRARSGCCAATPEPTVLKSFVVTGARPRDGWPRPSRAISLTPCSRSTGRSTWANPDSVLPE